MKYPQIVSKATVGRVGTQAERNEIDSENNIQSAYRVHGYWDADLCRQVARHNGENTVENRRLAI